MFLCVLHTVPPSISSDPEDIVQLLSPASLSLNCTAEGLPMPTIRWFRTLDNGSVVELTTDGGLISTVNLTDTSIQSTFTIDLALAIDTANYSCQASNRLGTSNSTVSVFIYGKV